MTALHEQRRKIFSEPAVNLNAAGYRRRKHLLDGAVEFLDHVKFFNAALVELGVTHHLGDDLVRVHNFLLNDFKLFRGSGLPARRARCNENTALLMTASGFLI